MSITPAAVPAHLQPHVDTLVRAAAAGIHEPRGAAFDIVSSWSETDTDNSSFYTADHGDSFPLIWPATELARWSDAEIAFAEGSEGEPLDDAVRVAFLRERLHGLTDGTMGEPGDDWRACELRMAASDGTAASLCFLMRGYSFEGGPEIDWLGVYRCLEELQAEYQAKGALTAAADVERMGDAELLAVWNRLHAR